MSNINNKVGLRTHARSPSSITNSEHHDPSRSKRTLDGLPSEIKSITNDANEHAVADGAIIRVANTTGAAIFAWTGIHGDAPGTVNGTNGVAIMPGTTELIFMGASPDTAKSKAYKLSAAEQVVVYQE